MHIYIYIYVYVSIYIYIYIGMYKCVLLARILLSDKTYTNIYPCVVSLLPLSSVVEPQLQFGNSVRA